MLSSFFKFMRGIAYLVAVSAAMGFLGGVVGGAATVAYYAITNSWAP